VSELRLTLIGKPGCHLCDDARAVVNSVLAEREPDARGYALEKVSILDDAQLYERYVEEIPVLLIDGKVHTYWRVDPTRLKKALQEDR
jgi:glutaredoxin